jgi:hypothetical protein
VLALGLHLERRLVLLGSMLLSIFLAILTYLCMVQKLLPQALSPCST